MLMKSGPRLDFELLDPHRSIVLLHNRPAIINNPVHNHFMKFGELIALESCRYAFSYNSEPHLLKERDIPRLPNRINPYDAMARASGVFDDPIDQLAGNAMSLANGMDSQSHNMQMVAMIGDLHCRHDAAIDLGDQTCSLAPAFVLPSGQFANGSIDRPKRRESGVMHHLCFAQVMVAGFSDYHIFVSRIFRK